MKILPSLAEKMEFKGDQEQMRGGVPVFGQTSEQYGGLVVPFGLNTETHYSANQIQYENDGSMVGGAGDSDPVIPDDTFSQLFDKVMDTKKSKFHGGSKASKRSVQSRPITKKTKKQR